LIRYGRKSLHKKKFEEQFIFGMKYDFIYDNSINTQPRGFYFQAGIGTSGNLLDLVKRIPSEETERPYSVLEVYIPVY